jgi:hypothetical protein
LRFIAETQQAGNLLMSPAWRTFVCPEEVK